MDQALIDQILTELNAEKTLIEAALQQSKISYKNLQDQANVMWIEVAGLQRKLEVISKFISNIQVLSDN